ncbi:MAG: alpha-1,2-fucosyltransferase [Treponema sp.]
MDGGLCSQMFDYELGELFRESGYLVKFDLTWFKNCGRDVFGKDARFFELNKIYPELKIKNASKICIEKFRDKCKNSEYDIEKCIENKKNTYLINDKPLTLPNKRLNEILKKLFSNPSPKLDDVNLSLKEEIIQTKNSCAVHVRRGDLADAGIAKNSGYGKLVSDNYYKKAVSFMNRLIPDVKFYFFSDDMDYVQKNLIPLFGKINYRIVSENKNTILNGGGV